MRPRRSSRLARWAGVIPGASCRPFSVRSSTGPAHVEQNPFGGLERDVDGNAPAVRRTPPGVGYEACIGRMVPQVPLRLRGTEGIRDHKAKVLLARQADGTAKAPCGLLDEKAAWPGVDPPSREVVPFSVDEVDRDVPVGSRDLDKACCQGKSVLFHCCSCVGDVEFEGFLRYMSCCAGSGSGLRVGGHFEPVEDGSEFSVEAQCCWFDIQPACLDEADCEAPEA